MDDLSEKEQIESIRAWWDEYGNYVIGGVVIGALLLFGWNYYKTSKANAEIGASVLYDELADHVAEGRVAEAERVAGDLDGTYPDSGYAVQGKLAMARLYMDNNRDADAAAVLRDLMEQRSSPAFAAIARLRLAKILQYQEKYEEVLELLADQDTPGFSARYADARGDALVELGRFDEAREEYLAALTDNGQTVDASFLQLKILDLPAPGDAVDAAMDDGDVVVPLPSDSTTDADATRSEAADEDGAEASDQPEAADADESETAETPQ